MNTRRFLLAVAFAAMAFTFFACSSDEPGGDGNSSSSDATQGGSINLSDLPTQVYLVERDDDIEIKREKYESDGNVFTYLHYEDGGEKSPPVGEIRDGQVSLNLPANIDSKYLKPFGFSDEPACQSTISVVPKNLTAFFSKYYVTIPDRSDCGFGLYLMEPGKEKWGDVIFIYSSEPGRISGTEICTRPDGSIIDQANLDNLNFSKGWNPVYIDGDYWTTDIPKGGTLEWWLRCSQ